MKRVAALNLFPIVGLLFFAACVAYAKPAPASEQSLTALRQHSPSASASRNQFNINNRTQIASTNEDARILHVLNRLTFGPRPGDVEAVRTIGVDRFIQQQLNPEQIPIPETVSKVAQYPSLRETPARMFLTFGRPAIQALAKAGREQNNNAESAGANLDGAARSSSATRGEEKAKRNRIDPDGQKLLRDNYKTIYGQATTARLTRALQSPRQLEELMVDFWFNHFNVSMDKGLDHLWTAGYEENAIRPHVLGKFRNLLGATSHHAAMLFYLDNWQNTAPQSQGARGRFKGINENYARELLELHTLGVDGGYAQKDVVELARVLTGLGLQGRKGLRVTGGGMNSPNGVFFDAARHDFTDKVLLGQRIKGSGEGEIEQALDMLARHPSTARHISYKLAQYFVTDKPPAALVEKLAARFTQTDGDIKQVLSTLFQSEDFWNTAHIGTKFKNPQRYLYSSLRAVDADVKNQFMALAFLKQSGMPLYQCLTPDGYKNTQEAWLSPDALTNRINVATILATGRVPGITPRLNDYRILFKNLGPSVSTQTANTIASAPQPIRSALVLGSPEFMMY